MARSNAGKKSQEIVAYYYMAVLIDVHGKEWYPNYRYRPYVIVGPAKAYRTIAVGNQQRKLAQNPNADRFGTYGQSFIQPDGRTVWESFLKPTDTRNYPLDRIEYRIYRLDQHGISIVP